MRIGRPFEVLALALLAIAGYPQAPSRLIGEVTALDPAGNPITIRPDSGGADVGLDDRILARSSPATSVIVMTKADLPQKHQRDRAEWQRRGVAGVITARNPETRQITITTRSHEGPKTILIEPAGNVMFRRYAPDSIRFSETA